MTEPEAKKEKSLVKEEQVAYKIEFKRLNKVALLTGGLFILLALFNIPFLYNPEMNQLTFNLSGKPTFMLGGNLTFYLFVGIIPLFIGLLVVIFALCTSRKKTFLLTADGSCLYKNKSFQFKDDLQRIQLGKRHQRFVIWFPVAIMIFLVFLLLDYMNFLAPSFDITTTFFGIEYSVKIMLLFNVFFIIGTLLLITLFPRRLCRIDTAEFYIKFNYSSLNVQLISEPPHAFPYLKAFEVLSSTKPSKVTPPPQAPTPPAHYPEILKHQLTDPTFAHIPLLSLGCNVLLFLSIFLPQFLPDFFLGGFTFRIEYFLAVIAFYFIVRTLQNKWYSAQRIELIDDPANLLIFRSNKFFGDSIDYFAHIAAIKRDSTTRAPNFFEYIFLFIPIMEIFWLLSYYLTYTDYFFTQNWYTFLYLSLIIGIFLLLAVEYVFPHETLMITPNAQLPSRKAPETFHIYFPPTPILTSLPILENFKQKKFLQTSYRGLLLLLIPIIFTLTWILLSAIGIMPPLSDTIF
ncbi:MAG: hypothetical protein ACTSRS_12565 [Candidatus Helarchaeota archaeon]